MIRYIFIFLVPVILSCSSGFKRNQTVNSGKNETVITNTAGKGQEITIDFYRGKYFYYPLMAVWLEDESGKYIQTLFVPRSVATGTFRYGRQEKNKWVEAPKRAPQTLPYWAHKRGVVASDGLFMPEPGNPVPDAYSGATPVTGFTLITKADNRPSGETGELFSDISTLTTALQIADSIVVRIK